MEKNNKGLMILIAILSVIILGLVGYIAYDKISENDEKSLSIDEKKGLEIYKLFVGNGTGPFEWENSIVTNYDVVMSKMTDSYKESFNSGGEDHGFSIPVKENGVWKNYGGWGTDKTSLFRDIRVVSKDSCRIRYEVKYEYTFLNDPSKKYEDVNEFVVKTNSCDSNDTDIDFSNGYKMDDFNLVYGLKF